MRRPTSHSGLTNIQSGLPYGGGATMAAPRRKPNSSLKTGDNKENSITFVGNCLYLGFGSALRRKNDAEQDPFVRPYLPGSANMRTTIRRDHIVDLVIGNRRPFAVDLDLVMVADHAALRRTTVHEVTAGASAVARIGHVSCRHGGAQLPGQDVAREGIEHGGQIEPAPADDLRIGEVGLPKLVWGVC